MLLFDVVVVHIDALDVRILATVNVGPDEAIQIDGVEVLDTPDSPGAAAVARGGRRVGESPRGGTPGEGRGGGGGRRGAGEE